MALLEVRHDGVDHAVAVIDQRNQPPLVESRAGMRDAAADEIANLQVFGGVKTQVSVLVVGVEDARLLRELAGSLMSSLDVSRHGEVHVVRHIALAEAEQGEAGLRRRQNDAPNFKSFGERVGARQPRAEWSDLLVVRGVMRQVAAAAQHRAHGPRQLPWATEPGDDAVEERTAAGGQ